MTEEIKPYAQSADESWDPSLDKTATAGPKNRASETEIAAWAASVRESFGRDRQGFNFAVCDTLAAQGHQPTAASVLRIGKWGQTTSVATDVSQWYEQLATRLTSIEASIPLPARRHANELIEKLFELSMQTAEQSKAEAIEPLKTELAEFAEANDRLKDKVEDLRTREKLLGDTLGQKVDALAELETAYEALKEKLVEAKSASAAQSQAHGQELDALNASLRKAAQDVADAKAAHATALLDANTKAEAERRRLMLANDAEKVEAGKRLQSVHDDLAATKAALDAVRQELSKSSVEAAAASASLAGATALLASERSQFAKREAQLDSESHRMSGLVEFLMRSKQGGFKLSLSAKAQDKALLWLETSLGISAALAKRLLEIVPEEPPVPEPEVTEKKPLTGKKKV